MASKSTTERRGVPLRPDWASFAEREYVGQFVRSVAIIGRAAAGDGRPLTVPDKWRDGGTDLELILRAASSPLTSASVGAVLAQVSKQLLRSLIPYSAGAALLTSGIQVEWDGAGSISFPAIATAAGMAGFVAEAAPIPSWIAPTSGGPTLNPSFLSALVSATREMLHLDMVEAILRQKVVDAAAVALDASLFSNAAAIAQTSPAGLLNGVTPLSAAAITGVSKNEACTDDVVALIDAISPVLGNSPAVFIANAREGAGLKLRTLGAFDFDVFTTSVLPAKTVIAVASQALVSAVSLPRVEGSTAAVVHEQSVPAELVTAGGALAASQRSFFQSDATSIRLRWPMSWGLRDSRAIAFVSGVNW